MGMMITPIWPGDILHFYSVYLAMGCGLLLFSRRSLLGLSTLPTLIFALAMFGLDFERGWQWTQLPLTEIWNLPGVLNHLLLAGPYPVFPWFSFILLGMWIGRQDLSNSLVRKRLFLMGGCALVLAECLSQAGSRLSAMFPHVVDGENLLSWLAIDAWEPMPMFVLSAGGTALIVISLCAVLAEKRQGVWWLFPLAAVGRCTLTLYVAHAVLGGLLLNAVRFLRWDTSLFPLWGTIFFFSAAILFCQLWCRHHPRGPLESAMRWVAAQHWPRGRRAQARAAYRRKSPRRQFSAYQGSGLRRTASLSFDNPEY
jgi:uncharacterized membrane protein YeiB